MILRKFMRAKSAFSAITGSSPIKVMTTALQQGVDKDKMKMGCVRKNEETGTLIQCAGMWIRQYRDIPRMPVQKAISASLDWLKPQSRREPRWRVKHTPPHEKNEWGGDVGGQKLSSIV